MSDAAAQTVLSFYSFPPGMVRRIESLGNAGGWSGSQIWKIGLAYSAVGNALRGVPGTADSPEFLCLRRWPREHPSERRLQFIHQILEDVSARGRELRGILPLPLRTFEGKSYVQSSGLFWELTTWLPGKADFHALPSRWRLQQGMLTLMSFHRLAARSYTQVGQPPCVLERLSQLDAVRGEQLATIQDAAIRRDSPTLDDRAVRMIPLLVPRLEPLRQRLLPLSQKQLPLHPAIRDVHHDHLLFTNERLTGLIDFGAMRIDTQLMDVARLVGSLVGDDAEERRFALETYAEFRKLSANDISLIDLLDESGVVLGALNWLTWLYIDCRDMGPPEPIIRRLDEILRRLEHLAAR